VLKDVEAVFHFAAQANVRKSVADPFFDLDVNVKDIDRFIFQRMRTIRPIQFHPVVCQSCPARII